MGLGDRLRGPLGDAARTWARAKATELLTTDDLKREHAAHEAEVARRELQRTGSEALARRTVPQYADWRERQEADLERIDAEEERAHRRGQALLPRCAVSIRITGALDAAWSGELPVHWQLTPPPPPSLDPEVRAEAEADPFAGRALLALEVDPVAEERPELAGVPLAVWSAWVAGYAGDGTYDLTAIAREQQDAGVDAPYQPGLALAEPDGSYWLDPAAEPSTITFDDDGSHAVARLHLVGVNGRLRAEVELTRH